MHSWRLIHRCASACLGIALVLSGFVLSGAHEGERVRADLSGSVEQPAPQPAPKTEPAPKLDTVVPPEADEAPEAKPETKKSPAASRPVVTTQQTVVPTAATPPTQPGEHKLVAELPDTTTRDFGMVGVTWSEATTETDLTVDIRTRTNGAWSSWEQLELDDLTEGGRPGTEPVWVGQADGVAVKVATASGAKPADIKVMTIDPGTSPADSDPEPTTAPGSDPAAVTATGTATTSGAMTVTPAVYNPNDVVDGTVDATETADGSPTYTPKPAIITRAGWGAAKNTKCNTPLTGNSTHGAIVHHTAGTNTYTKANSAAIVRSDQAYHMKGHGWCDIGYNFLVDKYGQIFEGRNGGVDRQVRAAHSGNGEVNTYGMGIAMAGNFEKTEPSAALKDSMVKLIGWRFGTNYKSAKGTYYVGEKVTASARAGTHTMNLISGHRNVVSTACPGAKAYAWLSAKGGLRDRVGAYVAKYSSPIKTLAAKLGASATGPVYVGEAPAGSGRRTRFGKLNIFWSKATGARVVSGAILTEYARVGASASKLGFPTAAYKVSADKKTGTQTFSGGYIWYTASTKKAVTRVASATPAPTPPAPSTTPAKPTGLKAAPTSSGATLSWSAAKNAKRYSICLLTSGTTTKCTKVVNNLATTRTVVSGLKPTSGTDWYFKVRSINGTKTAWSGTVGFDLKAAPAPASADNVTVPGSRSFVLKGHGYGHGIGMSQYGAQNAAILGASHGAIIRYYYPGTTLTGVGNKAIRVLISKDTSSSVDIRRASGGSLVFRNTRTGKGLALPTSVKGVKATRWRIIPDPAKPTQSLLQVSAGGWKNYDKPFTANGQFESSQPIGLVLPDSSTVKYRGVLRSAIPKAGSKVRDTVNVLGIDDYTRGVVAAEMPSSWRQSALRAQSAAARTYGYRSVKTGGYYDICDTTSCQVYRGVSVETANTDAAVAATSNKVITYQGKPAFTQFSSSSGGYSAAGSQPYLKQKADKYDDWAGNGVHDWTATVKAATLEKAYPAIGTLKTLKVTDRTDAGEWGGRIVSLKLTGSKGTKTITGNDARFALGLRSNWFRFN